MVDMVDMVDIVDIVDIVDMVFVESRRSWCDVGRGRVRSRANDYKSAMI